MLNSFEQGWIGEEGTIANGLVHAGIVLQDALACANILVPNLRVAHLAFRQANRLSRGFNGCMRPFACQPVNVGCTCQGNSVALFTWINAPAVHNN